MTRYAIIRFSNIVTIAAMLPVMANAALDTNQIEKITGLKGVWSATEGVFKVTVPRNDVKIVVDGWTMPPFMGLGTWAAFTQSKMGGAMVMGDTVLFQDEVNPVMSAALDNGLAVTALHNHFFYDEPKVYFMHIGGEGPPEKLAAAVKGVWDAIKKVRAEHKEPATRFQGETPKAGTIDAAAIEKILDHKGETQQGVVKV